MNERGIICVIDGAHAAGQVELDLESLGQCYYLGNCHKWMFTERGAGFLYDGYNKPELLTENTISTTRYKKSSDEVPSLWNRFNWRGTQSSASLFSILSARSFASRLHFEGFKGIIRHNVEMGKYALSQLQRVPNIVAPKSVNLAMITVKLPDSPFPEGEATTVFSEELKRYGFSVPTYMWPANPNRLLRLCLNVYNTKDSVNSVVSAISYILKKEQYVLRGDPRVGLNIGRSTFMNMVLPPDRYYDASRAGDSIEDADNVLVQGAVRRACLYALGSENKSSLKLPETQFPNAEKQKNEYFSITEWQSNNPESELFKIKSILTTLSRKR